MARTIPAVAAAAGILLSCAGSLADPPVLTDESRDGAVAAVSPAAVSPADGLPKHDGSGSPVIATLRTRDSELTILSEGGSMRYSLRSFVAGAADETRSLTPEQLRSYDPNLFEFVKEAMARGVGHASSGVFVDARVEPGARSGASGTDPTGTSISTDRNAVGLPSVPRLPPRR